ncbi:MAG: alpha/beta hydrolase-fold protein [Pyrinomonadaceae bacterium]
MASKILDENVEIKIYLPPGYKGSEAKYPVFYLLDGQWFFLHAVSSQIAYTQRGVPETPEFIVVGIVTQGDRREKWLLTDSRPFLEFIERELISFVDKNFRTSGERILFGWEASAGLVIGALTQKNELFDAYLAASPTPLYGSYFPGYEKQYRALERLFSDEKQSDKFLYFTAAENDYPAQYGIDKLRQLLEEKKSPIRWEYRKLKGAEHRETAYGTIFRGLKSYYYNYPALTFNSLAEFRESGEMKYIDQYYRKRADRFGFKDKADLEKNLQMTRTNLMLLAVAEDDFRTFDLLIGKFEADDFLNKSFLGHANSYAQFYLKNKKPKKALDILNSLLKRFPASARIFNSLGDVYATLNDKAKALEYYKKAVALSRENPDGRIDEYEKDLKNLSLSN